MTRKLASNPQQFTPTSASDTIFQNGSLMLILRAKKKIKYFHTYANVDPEDTYLLTFKKNPFKPLQLCGN